MSECIVCVIMCSELGHIQPPWCVRMDHVLFFTLGLFSLHYVENLNDFFLCVLENLLISRKYKNDICALDVTKDHAVMMSFCSFHADRCHGDKLHFINNGPCKGDVNWARFRASISEKSLVQKPCESDTCYEWETCSGTCTHMRKRVHTLLHARVIYIQSLTE